MSEMQSWMWRPEELEAGEKVKCKEIGGVIITVGFCCKDAYENFPMRKFACCESAVKYRVYCNDCVAKQPWYIARIEEIMAKEEPLN